MVEQDYDFDFHEALKRRIRESENNFRRGVNEAREAYRNFHGRRILMYEGLIRHLKAERAVLRRESSRMRKQIAELEEQNEAKRKEMERRENFVTKAIKGVTRVFDRFYRRKSENEAYNSQEAES